VLRRSTQEKGERFDEGRLFSQIWCGGTPHRFRPTKQRTEQDEAREHTPPLAVAHHFNHQVWFQPHDIQFRSHPALIGIVCGCCTAVSHASTHHCSALGKRGQADCKTICLRDLRSPPHHVCRGTCTSADGMTHAGVGASNFEADQVRRRLRLLASCLANTQKHVMPSA